MADTLASNTSLCIGDIRLKNVATFESHCSAPSSYTLHEKTFESETESFACYGIVRTGHITLEDFFQSTQLDFETIAVVGLKLDSAYA